MKRRTFLTTTGAASVVALAGCAELERAEDSPDDTDDSSADDTDDGTTTEETEDTLVVGTYSSFLDAPSISPGEWVKNTFEEEFDATLVWQSPPGEINHYIQRKQEGVGIDADVYLGLNTDELVRVDEQLDEPLFVNGLEIDGQEHVQPALEFDPDGRAIPFDTGYISLVYDSTETEAPETFEELREPDHASTLIAQHPGTSTTGLAFLLHTVHRYGDDEYLDFWADVQEGGATILGSWDDAYGAWLDGQAPVVVSYSTDQVFAAADGANLDEHQIRFLDDQAYANPEGMARFDGADSPGLAEEFMEFILRPDVQGEIAEQNVAFPATDNAELPDDYDELAHEPPEPVTFSYDELQGNVDEWVDNWERQITL